MDGGEAWTARSIISIDRTWAGSSHRYTADIPVFMFFWSLACMVCTYLDTTTTEEETGAQTIT